MTLNKHRMDPIIYKWKLVEAQLLFNFSLEIYEGQLREGRHFLHEHPTGARSWQEPRMKELLEHSKVRSVVAHLCQYGMTTKGESGERVAARKSTRFASSSSAILARLSRKCDGSHVHGHLLDGKASAAALYPPDLCRAILLGTEDQRRAEGHAMPAHIGKLLETGCGLYNLDPGSDVVEVEDAPGYHDLQHEDDALKDLDYNPGADDASYWDELSGEALDPGRSGKLGGRKLSSWWLGKSGR